MGESDGVVLRAAMSQLGGEVEAVIHTRASDGRELVHRLSVDASGVLLVQSYDVSGGRLDGVSEVTVDLMPEAAGGAPVRLADVLDLCDRLGRAA
jgi:hypothetical protein